MKTEKVTGVKFGNCLNWKSNILDYVLRFIRIWNFHRYIFEFQRRTWSISWGQTPGGLSQVILTIAVIVRGI